MKIATEKQLKFMMDLGIINEPTYNGREYTAEEAKRMIDEELARRESLGQDGSNRKISKAAPQSSAFIRPDAQKLSIEAQCATKMAVELCIAGKIELNQLAMQAAELLTIIRSLQKI